MWLASERQRVNNIFLRLLLTAGPALAQVNSSTSTTNDVAKSVSSTTSAEPTCESRTVNYITHTLPQQCLASASSPFSTPASISATITSASIPVDSTPSADATTHHEELDADGNDLSTGAFMSFEEWKAMMLEKSGQDAWEPRQRKSKEAHGDGEPGDDLDSLGDEGEVSFDFDAYSNRISEIASSTKPSQKEKEKEKQVEKVNYDEGLAQGYRSKDAGKTCKERLSYASFDAGATVKKASPGAKNPKAILVENKDTYMLLECAMQNKFVIIELSDDILVDTVVIANFEFFSSMIRHFRVSVSDRYPVKLEKWKVLGTFEARNSRDIQPFLVENPQIWAKYLRIEILSHYGNEYYCPMSLLRVHGTRMLDSWKEADPADLEPEEDKTIPEPPEEMVEEPEVQTEEAEVTEASQQEDQVVLSEQSDFIPYWDEDYFCHFYPFNATCDAAAAEDYASQRSKENYKNKTAAKPQPVRTVGQTISISSSASSPATPTSESASQVTADSARSVYPSSSSETTASTATANSTESVPVPTSSPDPRSATVTPTTTTTTPTAVASSNLVKTASVQSPPRSKTSVSTSIVKPPSSRSASSKSQPTGSPTTPRNKTTSTTSSSTPAHTVQDSFFKALNKRILALESNTTLSLQYIESQSRFLREALARLEKRQVAKVDLFLDTLNKTVLGELREVRVQYDQIWQSTVIALETQREQSEREIVALSTRLGVLADEVIFQKRMAIVQSVLLLGCLLLVIFSRGGLAQAAAESSYYPAQFFGGGGGPSRLASPIFPSTPRARTHHRDSTASLLSPSDASPGPIPIPSTPQQSHLHRAPNQTPESSLHHRPRRMSSSRPVPGIIGSNINNINDTPESIPHRRPSPNRATSEPPEDSYYHAPTPASVEAGYDSEPAMTPSRDGEYYSTPIVDTGKSTALSYPEALARKAERQLTPSSETDSAEYIPLSSRPPLTHSTSAQKPLPTLPEDPD